ncbi:MAG: dTDP-4-dehydrorhamnose 3,5-epimerase [Vallitalea sp.]|jgi:dTDP-4-dehydrorhamnose 3,5-epimerase|nr:dTDP-4-dehydrorhamnose 3,5-epimerase [Vallitalea sp.]
MNIIKTQLQGVYVIENFHSKDNRGSFTKTYNADSFKENNLCTQFHESYYSVSNKDVIRGMHFQLPPYEHEKLVYVAKGEIIDVILDIRKSSDTYGKYLQVILSDKNHMSVYIPKGLAHGFRSNINNTITVYNVSTVYNKEKDCGIKYNSFGYDWNIEKPIISTRDSSFINFVEFKKENPF